MPTDYIVVGIRACGPFIVAEQRESAVYKSIFRFCCLVGLLLVVSATSEIATGKSHRNNGFLTAHGPELVLCDDAIDDRAKALYLAAFARRESMQQIQLEAVVEFKNLSDQQPFHFRAREQTVMDRINHRSFFQQEKEIVESSQGARSEHARILIRDGIRYQKLLRDKHEFSIETVKSDSSLGAINSEIGMFNVFLLGVAATSLSDFGPGLLEQIRDFIHVKSLKLGKSINHEGTMVQELIFRTTFLDDLELVCLD